MARVKKSVTLDSVRVRGITIINGTTPTVEVYYDIVTSDTGTVLPKTKDVTALLPAGVRTAIANLLSGAQQLIENSDL
jgi:hypothetical protein